MFCFVPINTREVSPFCLGRESPAAVVERNLLQLADLPSRTARVIFCVLMTLGEITMTWAVGRLSVLVVLALGVFSVVMTAAVVGPANATNGVMTEGETADFDMFVDDDFSTSDTATVPTDITITGEPDPGLPGAAEALNGEYVVTTGGSQQTAVLGAIMFDPSGIIVSGTLSIVSSPTAGSSTAPDVESMGVVDEFGDDEPLAPAPTGGSATITDCTATGGSYTLSTGGGGEAQVELDCGGSSSTAVWRLFVIAGDDLAQAQQVRAVQIDPVVDDDLIELVLTLR